mmetsp:Transcript_23979/g.72026  ORF Transcript_23979/g.72026 Transcript_23979/m.72026 type:complete len:273 (+) Transcript_23979:999-1817(+)
MRGRGRRGPQRLRRCCGGRVRRERAGAGVGQVWGKPDFQLQLRVRGRGGHRRDHGRRLRVRGPRPGLEPGALGGDGRAGGGRRERCPERGPPGDHPCAGSDIDFDHYPDVDLDHRDGDQHYHDVVNDDGQHYDHRQFDDVDEHHVDLNHHADDFDDQFQHVHHHEHDPDDDVDHGHARNELLADAGRSPDQHERVLRVEPELVRELHEGWPRGLTDASSGRVPMHVVPVELARGAHHAGHAGRPGEQRRPRPGRRRGRPHAARGGRGWRFFH